LEKLIDEVEDEISGLKEEVKEQQELETSVEKM